MGKAASASRKKKNITVRKDGEPFYTLKMREWLGGYDPVIAPRFGRLRSDAERRQTALRERERRAMDNAGWGSGGMTGLSNKADERLRAMPVRMLIVGTSR